MAIKPGVVFPQTEIGTDPERVREYARAAEEVGYEALLAPEHVLGGDPETSEGFDRSDQFHEPFCLFAHLAAVTDAIRLVSAVLVLPQRQTALVAKQAATLDVLSAGRFTLGVGVGWNDLEYEALGTEFATRGRRIEEQIEVMRSLWSDELVDYEGEFHRISEGGLNPRPVQRPIPIWMGGSADRVLRRIARLADGWLSLEDAGPALDDGIATLREHARDVGRDPDELSVVAYLGLEGEDPDGWIEQAEAYCRREALTHLVVNTTASLDLDAPADHAETIRQFALAARESDLDLDWE